MQGDTPLEEERQLEQLAEDDPFLAEAMEGYRRHPEGQHGEYVKRLKARIRAKGRKRRGVLFYLPRAAAAAVFLAVAVGGFWYINQSGSEQASLAVRERAVEQDEAKEIPITTEANELSGQEKAGGETPSPTPPEEKVTGAPVEPPPPARARTTPKPKKKQETALSQDIAVAENAAAGQAEPLPTLPEQIQEEPKAEEISQYAITRETAEDSSKEQPKADPAPGVISRMAPAAARTEPSAPPLPRTVTGTVTGTDGEPLIGASVLVEGTGLGTATGFDGRFTLQVPGLEAPTLLVTYVGFESQQITLGNKDTLAIALPEGEPLLDAVTVTGYGKERQTAPRPEGGFAELRRYIRDNLQYPEAARRNSTEGKVKLSFRIQPNGTPGDFTVQKRLGDGCDEEAIRLLEEGPKWEGAGQEATYTVRFKF